MALVGGFAMMAPRRPEQDYDNEVKTELLEAKESEITEEKEWLPSARKIATLAVQPLRMNHE